MTLDSKIGEPSSTARAKEGSSLMSTGKSKSGNEQRDD